MQFIEGQSLAALIAELRRLAGDPERPSGPPSPSEAAAETTGPVRAVGAGETRGGEGDRLPAGQPSRDRSAHRSDVYSLGATLSELLTLRPLFGGRDRHELLRQISDEEPRPPRSIEPAIPAELETILLKALAKEPGERYATAQELADDLERFR